MRVLIPSDNRDFVIELASAYHHAGCDVVTGAFNFDLGCASFDLVHFQWPEEFSGWKPPSESTLKRIEDRVRWWEDRCPTIATAHNFYPHGYEGHNDYKRLYDVFYKTCSRTLHFSEFSRQLVCREFAGAKHERHFVGSPWYYRATLYVQKNRGSCRDAFGFSNDDFVVLILGALRSWDEVRLVMDGFTACEVPRKKLLMAGRFHDNGSRLQRKWRQMQWRLWQWRHHAVAVESYIPDDQLYRYFDTADIVVVPRLTDISSGIPGLAMTFGTMVAAPSHGAFPEYLEGTENLLYDSGKPRSLAAALDKAAAMDRSQIAAKNRERSWQQHWGNLVSDCLRAAENVERPVVWQTERQVDGTVIT